MFVYAFELQSLFYSLFANNFTVLGAATPLSAEKVLSSAAFAIRDTLSVMKVVEFLLNRLLPSVDLSQFIHKTAFVLRFLVIHLETSKREK